MFTSSSGGNRLCFGAAITPGTCFLLTQEGTPLCENDVIQVQHPSECIGGSACVCVSRVCVCASIHHLLVSYVLEDKEMSLSCVNVYALLLLSFIVYSIGLGVFTFITMYMS